MAEDMETKDGVENVLDDILVREEEDMLLSGDLPEAVKKVTKPTTKKVVKKKVAATTTKMGAKTITAKVAAGKAPAKTAGSGTTVKKVKKVVKKSATSTQSAKPETSAAAATTTTPDKKAERPKTKTDTSETQPKKGDDEIKDLERKRQQLAKENAERKKKLDKLKEEEKILSVAADLDDQDEQDYEEIDEGEENLNYSFSADEEKEVKVKKEKEDGDGNLEYDTRSEAGTSSGTSESESETDTSDSESDDGEERKGKRHKYQSGQRGISPIEWDQKTASGQEKSDSDDDSTTKEELADRNVRYLKYIFRDAKFYLIKSNNHENISLAKAKCVWSTPPQNEVKLNNAYREHRNVILIFSVKESGKFQGYARLAGLSDKDHPPVRWVLPPGLTARALSGVFRLQWINRKEVPFTKTMHLQNSWNDNKPIKIGRDGQEIEPYVGSELCRLFPNDDNIDVASLARKVKRERRNLVPKDFRDRPFHPPRREAIRRRHPGYDDYEIPRFKRSRPDFRDREPLYRDRRDRSPRFQGGVRRETFINGSYNDYMREFHSRPPPGGPSGYPGPPSYYESHSSHGPSYAYESHRSSNYPSSMDYSRPRREEKRPVSNYERDVDEFLRRTSSRERRHRERR
ncbi:YTH domain-containing protein 1-like [Lineus longissimus]|uniref:YTH domain-containing protein 1-like n=1 Tax=Lineus longissimus TaxID=88925 RepID=UPI00315C4EA3